MCKPVREGFDYHTEGHQGAVDVLGFFKSSACSSGEGGDGGVAEKGGEKEVERKEWRRRGSGREKRGRVLEEYIRRRKVR